MTTPNVYLTRKQLENVFYQFTVNALGLPTGTDKVRISYPTEGAPAYKINDDITFLYVREIHDTYGMERFLSNEEIDDNNLNEVMWHTRVLGVFWTFYGPNSFDNSHELEDKSFLRDYRDILIQNNLFIVADIPTPVRAPELFAKQWWERVDLNMKVYELVVHTRTINTVRQVPIAVETVLSDGTLETENFTVQ
jgi:hypothetical protein